MVKKITQYRYFGDNYNDSQYSAIQFVSKDPLMGENEEEIKELTEERQAEFNNMINEKEVYIMDDKGVYFLLGEGAEYNPDITYYTLDKRKRVNYPPTLRRMNLTSGSIFKYDYPIVKLGIQSFPGLKFKVNYNTDWIIVGMTGIYELDLTQSSGVINTLQFDPTSLDIIDKHLNAYLIIDIMSEMEE